MAPFKQSGDCSIEITERSEMITLNNVTMGFTERTLFKDVSLSIFRNEKIGLTGPNGAGKTTLFAIIRGEIEPLSGFVQTQKNINVGYLAQEAHFISERTVMQELTEGDQRIKDLMNEKRKYEDENRADAPRYGDVLQKLEELGIYELEHKAEKILIGLGFKEEDFNRPVKHLSGGWQMRTLLAKLLTYSYDLLLLDEPTNYLDLEATLWLKDYLMSYPGAFVLISHDRVFLNDVTNYTIILERGQINKLKGNYETYEEQKELQTKHLERQKKVIDKKRKQLEDFAQRFHAQPNRASAVRNKRKMIERLEDIELPQEMASIKDFEIPVAVESGYLVAHVQDIAKSYGEKQIYKDLNFEVIKGQKICLVGPNGAGKSTLLKMLAGVIAPDAGTIKYGHQVGLGYFSQTRLDVLSPNRNAFEEVVAAVPGGSVPALKVRSLLGLFNFHGDDVFKPVSVLSGGEKSRLILAKLLINPPNFMLLDEPTTHLDLDGVKALTSAFKNYAGTLVFISHDLYFINEISDHIVDVHAGKIKTYPGGLNYYLEKTGKKQLTFLRKDYEHAQTDDGSGTQGSSSKPNNSSSKGQSQNASSHDKSVSKMHEQHQQAKNRLSYIRNEIKRLQQEHKDLETESYVKARVLESTLENKHPDRIREIGQRLKFIQARLREIESTIKALEEERDTISR